MFQPSLADVQSNILKYHYRDHVKLLFIQFTGEPKAVKSWVGSIPNSFGLSSAEDDLKSYLNYKSNKRKFRKDVNCVLLLTRTGYQKMGFKKGMEGMPKDSVFWEGMDKRGEELNDPEKKLWEPNYKKRIDALIILADNSQEKIEIKKEDIIYSLLMKKLGKMIFEEASTSRLNAEGQKIEHFGFRDGLNQPKLWNKDKLLKENWKDILEDSVGGSYLVYRKLEQNVKLFNENIKTLSTELKVDTAYSEARVMGRYKDGRPLGDAWYANEGEIEMNDTNGLKCPFHSHVSKMKPPIKNNKYLPIIRRGVNYDSRKDKSNAEPETGVGLLFMCYQASIQDQFEILQAAWANNSDFPREYTGIDPIVGQNSDTLPKYKRGAYCTVRESVRFSGTVNLKGGAYFFAPGIPFIKNIKSYPKPHPKKKSKTQSYGSKLNFSALMRISRSGKKKKSFY